MWPFRNPGFLHPTVLPSPIKGIILVCMDKARSQAHSRCSSRKEEREGCGGTPLLKMTQKLHITLLFTPRGPELSHTATLCCKRGWNTISNFKPCAQLQMLSKQRNDCLTAVTLCHSLPPALLFFSNTWLVLGLAVSLCHLLNRASLGGSFREAIRHSGEI